MSAINDINMARVLGYISRVLETQQSDPLCGNCRAFASTAAEAREALSGFKASMERLPAEYMPLVESASRALDGLRIPAEPAAQRKEGRCALPEKACMVKHSKALFEKTLAEWKTQNTEDRK